jgi:hypothetical protein
MTLSRREALKRALGATAGAALAGCGVDRLLDPGISPNFLIQPGQVNLVGACDPHVKFPGHPSYAVAQRISARIADDPGASVFCTGDLVENGFASEYLNQYDVAWGPFKSRTLPTIGNHDDKQVPGATAYFDYWGVQAGAPGVGYYAKNFGEYWRGYFLNNEWGMAEQNAWMAADLQNWTDSRHIFAMWHHPHYASNCNHNGVRVAMNWAGIKGPGQLWETLQKHGAEFVNSGHVHRYERYPRMLRDPNNLFAGRPSALGLRQFITGTGGTPLMHPWEPHPQAERIVVAHGYAVFKLFRDRFEWTFIDLAGTVRDTGRQTCRKVL